MGSNGDMPSTREGFCYFRAGMEAATKHALAFGPCADLLWVEIGNPTVDAVRRRLGRAVLATHLGKGLV